MRFGERSCSGEAEKIFLFLPSHGQIRQATHSICSQLDRLTAFEDEHPDLVARLICEAKGYFYASKEYLAARGHPRSLSDLDQHDFVSMGDVSRMVDYLSNIGIHLERRQFQVGSENGVVGWALAQAGLGIIPMDAAVAQHSPNMVQLLPQTLISFPIWLTTHREIHTSPKMRLVFDVLAEVLARR